MARLLSWPAGLRANFREPLSGPRAVGSGQSEAISGFVQTTSAPFGLWRWRFQFPPIRGQLARRYRGWITALHGGANATRVEFCDWDGLTLAQMGVTTTQAEWKAGQPWSNGMPWESGNWASTPPVVAVAASAAQGATAVALAADYWGGSLDYGDLIGFFPNHLGMYMVTGINEDDSYRIWPPLRKALTTDDYATLRPTLAMRLENEEAASAARSAAFIENAGVTMVEVLDYDVEDYFAD